MTEKSLKEEGEKGYGVTLEELIALNEVGLSPAESGPPKWWSEAVGGVASWHLSLPLPYLLSLFPSPSRHTTVVIASECGPPRINVPPGESLQEGSLGQPKVYGWPEGVYAGDVCHRARRAPRGLLL